MVWSYFIIATIEVSGIILYKDIGLLPSILYLTDRYTVKKALYTLDFRLFLLYVV